MAGPGWRGRRAGGGQRSRRPLRHLPEQANSMLLGVRGAGCTVFASSRCELHEYRYLAISAIASPFRCSWMAQLDP